MTFGIQATIQALLELGCPPLPVAPKQDPRLPNCHHQTFLTVRFKGKATSTKIDGVDTPILGDYCRISSTKVDDFKAPVKGDYCRLDENLQPIARFTGKNPSYLDRNGKPRTVQHREYQTRLPTEAELKAWFTNPANGIGTLGGHNGIDWLDFDAKNYPTQKDCDRDVERIRQAVGSTWVEQTGSGGCRVAVRPKQKPTFTNFTTDPNGEGHIGEALWEGRFTVLAPTIHPNGKPYQRVELAAVAEVESLEAIGIYPTKDELSNQSRKEKRQKSGTAYIVSDPQDNPWDIRNLAEYLEGFHVAGDYIKCRCPVHKGNSDNSLSIHSATGGYKCWSGCDTQAIYKAAKEAAISGGYRPNLIKFRRVERQQLTRTPDLDIGIDEFKDHTENYPKTGLLALHGAKGTGKGEAIAQLLKGQSWLSVTTLRSLARDQAAGWGGVFLNDSDRFNGEILQNGETANGVCVCVPSLLKAKSRPAKVFVLDEAPTILEFTHGSKLANREGIRPLLIEELHRRIVEADLVILASADLTDRVLRYVETIRGEKAFLVRTNRKPLPYKTHRIEGSKHQAIADFIRRVNELPQDKVVILNCDTRKEAERISAQLLEQEHQSLLITSKTSGGEIESQFLSSKGSDLPAIIMTGVRAIIASPTVKEGFSIQQHTDRIDSVWGIFEGGSINAKAIAQTCDRVRSLVPRYLWIAAKGRAYSKISRAETIPAFMREFRSSSKALVQLTRKSLQIEVEAKVSNIDWNSENLELLADFEIQRNRDMKALRASVETILASEGKELCSYTPISTLAEAKALHKHLRRIKSRLEMEHAIAVQSAQKRTPEEVARLERKEALTPTEELELERFYLEQFYRLEHISTDDILWDRDGKKRSQIRHLEQILNPALAVQTSTDSINQNPDTPQDWKKAAVQRDLLEKSGAANLIRRIWSGEVVELLTEEIEPIAEYLKTYALQFDIAFNFSRLNTVSNRQAIAVLLDWCGITRKSHRCRVKGKVARRYFVEQGNLEKLKAIVGRRAQADPPPLETSICQGGGSHHEADLKTLEDIKSWWSTGGEVREFVLQNFPDWLIRRAIAS